MSAGVDYKKANNLSVIEAVAQGLSIDVPHRIWETMYGWCNAANSEVSGMGTVVADNGLYEVNDVFLPKQVGSGSGTEITPEGTASMMKHLFTNKLKQNSLKLWWHTHYNFGCFWSSTDHDNIERLIESSNDWLLSIVINQKGEYKARLDLASPFRITFDDLEVNVIYPGVGTEAQWKKDIKDNVTKYVAPPPKKLSLRDRMGLKPAGYMPNHGGFPSHDSGIVETPGDLGLFKGPDSDGNVWCNATMTFVDYRQGYLDDHSIWHAPTIGAKGA